MKRPAALGSGPAGPIRKRLRAMLAEARGLGRMTTEHELRALVAERLAAAADRASSAGDEGKFLRLSDKLLEVLDTLPVRVSEGGAAGDGSGDDERGRLLKLMDSPPTVGDAAHP